MEQVKARRWKGQDLPFAQHKMDGHRVLVCRGKMITRTGINLWDKIKDSRHAQVPEGVVLDCELHLPGLQATSVKTLLNEDPDRLVLTPFAVPSHRHLIFDAAMDLIRELGYTPPETLREFPCDEDWLLNHIEQEGIEGLVLKRCHMEEWFKLKPVETVDCVVMSTTKSTAPTQFGDLKAVQVGVYDGEELVRIASVGSGFTKEFRESCDRESLVGRVCEVSYDSVAAKGQLKFPRFVRWRDDKEATECTLSQIE